MPNLFSSPATRRILLALGAAFLLAALVFGIRRLTREVVYVRVAHPVQGDIVNSVSTNGKVEPVQLYQAHASAPGQVKAVFVRAGQQVSAGATLVKLDTADSELRVQTARTAIATASATQNDVQAGGSQQERLTLAGDIARARLQVDQGRQELAALQQLQNRGAASANEVAASRQRLLSSQSSLSSLQQQQTGRYSSGDRSRVAAQIAEGKSSLAAAEDQLSNGIIRAPFSGTVFSLPVKQFDYVATGDELVQVADLTRMQVRAYFDEPEIGKLRINDAVSMTWEARPGKQWHGHIVRVPTTVTSYGTRNVGECLIAVDDATGDLLPNTNVTARVTTQQVLHVLTIPRDALHTATTGVQNFVFVLRDGTLHKTPIQVGALNLQSVQVTSGLTPEDVLALNTTNNADLTDGLAVQESK